MPLAARANHGAATISTKRVGDLVAPHERRPQRILAGPDPPDQQPFRGDRDDAGHRTAASSTSPPHSRRRTRGRRSCQRLQCAQHRQPDRDRHDHRHAAGTSRRGARSTFSRERRVEGAALVGLGRTRGAAAPAGCPATTSRSWPWAASPKAPRPGRRRARDGPAGSCPSCRGMRACRPASRPRSPAAAEFVGRDHRVVGQERAVLDRRHLRAAAAPWRSRRRADPGAEQPQPDRRQQAGVEREQLVARAVHQPLGRPHLPADAAAHRVVALAQPERRAAARRSTVSSA